jgi:superfamily I DNA/RNA helicase
LNNYWKNKINKNNYYKYVYLHKSDEGKSINLKESEHAKRILSIHSSKGNGCEVVFLLKISEAPLLKFSKEKNIVYESLLHVGLTRQKRSLYIGLDIANDDITNRFDKEISNILPNISNIKKVIRYKKIINYWFKNNDPFCNEN